MQPHDPLRTAWRFSPGGLSFAQDRVWVTCHSNRDHSDRHTTPRHCRACRTTPSHWASSARPDASTSPSFAPPGVLRQSLLVVAEGEPRLRAGPASILPLGLGRQRVARSSFLLSQSQKATASFQLTQTTGWSSVWAKPGFLQVTYASLTSLPRRSTLHSLAAPLGLGPIAGRLARMTELADRDFVNARIERFSDLNRVDGASWASRPGSVPGDPIENLPAGIR